MHIFSLVRKDFRRKSVDKFQECFRLSPTPTSFGSYTDPILWSQGNALLLETFAEFKREKPLTAVYKEKKGLGKEGEMRNKGNEVLTF